MSKDSIIDGIVEAQQRLLKENIRANCVIGDRKYIQLRKRLYMTVCGNVVVIPQTVEGINETMAREIHLRNGAEP